MNLLIDKSFEKDISKISDKKLLNSIADCIDEIQLKTKLSELSNCKKLKGCKNTIVLIPLLGTFASLPLGDYRIGFIFENNTVELIRFLHRSKIYSFFPD
jgi:mRNA interferase RelE/StbE